jgi:5-methylthioadenosine/S-adenosylhomocysteine deaminase
MGTNTTTLAVTGGRVLRPDHRVERADVLVDVDAGTILEVGPNRSRAADETLDASGGLVIPGLVNAHCHAAMTLLRGYADDLPLDKWLREAVWPVEAELEPEDVRAGTDLACLELIRSGVTAFADMYFHSPEVVASVEAAGIRAVVGRGTVTLGKDADAGDADLAASVEFAREYDGAADGRIRTAVMPHSLTTVDDERLRASAEAARELGVPLHYHANETRDEVRPYVEGNRGDGSVRPLAYAADCGLADGAAGDFLAHAVHVDDAEIDLLADREVGVVHCPASNMKLASGAAPVPAMLEAGVTVAVGTDGPASNNDLDVFDELRDAAMLGKLAAEDAAAVPADAALEMATANGADVLGIDAGRIEPGRAADLAVVDLTAPHLTPEHDLVSNLVYAARGSDVRHTVCDGRVVMRDREVTTLDAEAVRERAAWRASALVGRAEGGDDGPGADDGGSAAE